MLGGRASPVAEAPAPGDHPSIGIAAHIGEIAGEPRAARVERRCGRLVLGRDRHRLQGAARFPLVVRHRQPHVVAPRRRVRVRSILGARGAPVAEAPAPGHHAAIRIGARVGEVARQPSAIRREGRGRRSVARGSVAGRAPGVAERLTGIRDELPLVARVPQGELQHAVGAVVAHLAVRGDRDEVHQACAPGADDEFPDPVGRVDSAARRLRREPLVVVIVPHHHHFRPGLVQCLPQRSRADRPTPAYPRGEERLVPDGERALLRAGGEIGAEPLLLVRTRGHRLVVVQRDDVPGAQIVAVVTGFLVSGGSPEVAEVTGRPGRRIVMVPDNGPGARLVAAPGGSIAVGVLVGGPVGVGVVAGGEDGARNLIEQLSRGLVVDVGAVGDVAGAHEDGGAGRHHGHARRAALASRGRADRRRPGRPSRHDAFGVDAGHGGVAARPGRRPAVDLLTAGIPGRGGELERRADLDATARRGDAD